MEEYEQMVTDCEERESRLSDWERGFIANIREWLAAGKSLTVKQADRLEVIWDRVTSRG